MISFLSRFISFGESIALRSGANRYHWGFLVGPKTESREPRNRAKGTLYHIKANDTNQWVFEAKQVSDVRNVDDLLVRLLIAKIKDTTRLADIFRTTPTSQEVTNDACRMWCELAFDAAVYDPVALGTVRGDWNWVWSFAAEYADSKVASDAESNTLQARVPKPTWDMLNREEIFP